MKLKNLIFTGLLASTAYQIYQNRNKLVAKINDTQEAINQGQTSLTNTQNQLQTLKAQTADLQKTKDSLAYSIKVFKEGSQPHLEAIKDILGHHKTADTKKKNYIF